MTILLDTRHIHEDEKVDAFLCAACRNAAGHWVNAVRSGLLSASPMGSGNRNEGSDGAQGPVGPARRHSRL